MTIKEQEKQKIKQEQEKQKIKQEQHKQKQNIYNIYTLRINYNNIFIK